MQLANPEQLTQLLQRIALSDADKFALNKRMANRARQFFRAHIREQRDIDNNPYQSRTQRRVTRLNGKTAQNTVNNKNMLLGLSKALRTHVDQGGFAVGISGIPTHLLREHNDGGAVTFTTHVNGHFNSKTSRWEGGVRVKQNYRMPKRTFLGWTPSLTRELMAMAAEQMMTGVNN